MLFVRPAFGSSLKRQLENKYIPGLVRSWKGELAAFTEDQWMRQRQDDSRPMPRMTHTVPAYPSEEDEDDEPAPVVNHVDGEFFPNERLIFIESTRIQKVLKETFRLLEKDGVFKQWGALSKRKEKPVDALKAVEGFAKNAMVTALRHLNVVFRDVIAHEICHAVDDDRIRCLRAAHPEQYAAVLVQSIVKVTEGKALRYSLKGLIKATADYIGFAPHRSGLQNSEPFRPFLKKVGEKQDEAALKNAGDIVSTVLAFDQSVAPSHSIRYSQFPHLKPYEASLQSLSPMSKSDLTEAKKALEAAVTNTFLMSLLDKKAQALGEVEDIIYRFRPKEVTAWEVGTKVRLQEVLKLNLSSQVAQKLSKQPALSLAVQSAMMAVDAPDDSDAIEKAALSALDTGVVDAKQREPLKQFLQKAFGKAKKAKNYQDAIFELDFTRACGRLMTVANQLAGSSGLSKERQSGLEKAYQSENRRFVAFVKEHRHQVPRHLVADKAFMTEPLQMFVREALSLTADEVS